MTITHAARELEHKIKLQNPSWSPAGPAEMETRNAQNIDIRIKRLDDPGNRHDPQSGVVAGNGYPLNKMRLDGGKLRMVTARRARALKKRGIPVRWSGNLGWYIWRMA